MVATVFYIPPGSGATRRRIRARAGFLVAADQHKHILHARESGRTRDWMCDFSQPQCVNKYSHGRCGLFCLWCVYMCAVHKLFEQEKGFTYEPAQAPSARS